MSLLHRAVLKTRRVPGLRAVYKEIYAAAAAASARLLGTLPGVDGVYLHRGMSREGWEPGVSDIDLILLLEQRDWDENHLLPALASRLKTLKRLFPMLGDIWLGSEAQLSQYLRWGGLRAWEDAPDWKLARGRGMTIPALAESALKRRWLDPWVWVLVNHMEISRRFFSAAREPQEKRDADIRKLYLDVRRYADFLLSDEDPGRTPMTRAQAKQRRPEAGQLSARELWLESSRTLALASRRVLAHAASGELGAAEFPAAAGETGERDRLSRLVAAVPGAWGSVSDMPYHAYLLLKEDAARTDYEKAADAIMKERPPGVALVLEPSAWALALQSSYLGAPLGWLGSGAGKGSAGGESFLGGWGPRGFGGPVSDIPLLPEPLRWEIAAEAASWMALWWRALWMGQGWPNRFVLYHLYTRALGLRLILDGQPSGPFGDWELLIARASLRFKEDARFLARLRGLLSRPDPALDSTARGELAPEYLAAASRLMRGLQSTLSEKPVSRARGLENNTSRTNRSKEASG